MSIKFEDIKNVDINRKNEIIERVIKIKNDYSNIVFAYNKDISYIIDKLYYYYTKDYNDYLNNIERLIFNVYGIFSDKNKFNELVAFYNKDFKKIGELYGVKEIYAKLRYYIEKDLTKDTKVLKKIKD